MMHGGTIVDADSGYVHTITGTSVTNLLREDDGVVYGTSGYLGAMNQPAIKEDEKKSKIEFRVNKRPSSFKMQNDFKGLNWDKKMKHEKAAVCCKVEHPYLIVKKQMGYSKAVCDNSRRNGAIKVCMNKFSEYVHTSYFDIEEFLYGFEAIEI